MSQSGDQNYDLVVVVDDNVVEIASYVTKLSDDDDAGCDAFKFEPASSHDNPLSKSSDGDDDNAPRRS